MLAVKDKVVVVDGGWGGDVGCELWKIRFYVFFVVVLWDWDSTQSQISVIYIALWIKNIN